VFHKQLSCLHALFFMVRVRLLFITLNVSGERFIFIVNLHAVVQSLSLFILWADFCCLVISWLLRGHTLVVINEGIVAQLLLKLDGSVLPKEIIDRQGTASDSDVDLILVNSDGNTLGTEMVDTVRFTHEHNLELLSVREVIDVLS